MTYGKMMVLMIRMDTVWYLLQEMKSSVGNNFRIHNLLEVA